MGPQISSVMLDTGHGLVNPALVTLKASHYNLAPTDNMGGSEADNM